MPKENNANSNASASSASSDQSLQNFVNKLSQVSCDASYMAVEKYRALHTSLEKIGFTREQVQDMAWGLDRGATLDAVNEHLEQLFELQFSLDQIAQMATKVGGYEKIEAVVKHYHTLQTLGWCDNQSIADLATQDLGELFIKAAAENYEALAARRYDNNQIMRLACHINHCHHINAILEMHDDLLALGFSQEGIVDLADRSRGNFDSRLLQAVAQYCHELNDLGITADAIRDIINNSSINHAQIFVAIGCYHSQLKTSDIQTEEIVDIAQQAQSHNEFIKAMLHRRQPSEKIDISRQNRDNFQFGISFFSVNNDCSGQFGQGYRSQQWTTLESGINIEPNQQSAANILVQMSQSEVYEPSQQTVNANMTAAASSSAASSSSVPTSGRSAITGKRKQTESVNSLSNNYAVFYSATAAPMSQTELIELDDSSDEDLFSMPSTSKRRR